MHFRGAATFAAFLLAVVNTANWGSAQDIDGDSPFVPRGFEESGRYFGFVPAHLQPPNPSPPIGGDFFGPPLVARSTRFWAHADYLLWWTKGVKTPPLVTTSTAGTPAAMAGVLGQSTTTVLFGGNHMHHDTAPGVKLTLGAWLNPEQTVGLEANYLNLDEDVDQFFASSNDLTIIARPFFNTNPGVNAQDASLTVFPGTSAGFLGVGSTTRFQSFEVLMRRLTWQSQTLSIDSLLGYRYAELQDNLRIDSNSTILSGVAAASNIVQFDQFATRNAFHGGILGMVLNWQPSQWWSTEFTGKVGFGGTRARTQISGGTVSTTAGGVSTTTASGLLTQGTNIGVFNQDDFSVLTELGLTLRRDFRTGVSATFGYTFFYWSDVARAGEKVDLNVNTTQIPPGALIGPPQPAFPFNESGFWAQGLKFGLEYTF